MTRNIYGNLTIPATEMVNGGVYADLELRLYLTNLGVTTLDQTQDVATSKLYTFTYTDQTGQTEKVKLYRKSTGAMLAESPSRGVLPRSFLLDSQDPAFGEPLNSTAYLTDSALALLAVTGARNMNLAKEIAGGMVLAEHNKNVPFMVHHQDASFVSGTTGSTLSSTAWSAYALLFYLEKNPYSSNKDAVAQAAFDLLHTLCQTRNAEGLLSDGASAYTVDNVLAWFAFAQAGKVLNEVYTDVAGELQSVIESELFDTSNKIFKLHSAGGTENLEVQSLGALYLAERGQLDNAKTVLTYIQNTYTVVDHVNNITGFKSVDGNLWLEGTYAVALAQYKVGRTDLYRKAIQPLNNTMNDDGSFNFAVVKDGLLQVKPWESVGATAWSFMTTFAPSIVFSIRNNVTPLTGITPRFINQEQSQTFTRNNCGAGTTPGTATYKVLAGSYESLVSQDDANQSALNEISAGGQTKANTVGACTTNPTFWNDQRTAQAIKSNCPSGYTGQAVTEVVAANTFGSTVSVADANAQADAYLASHVQAYADAQDGTYCVLTRETVRFYQTVSVQSNGSQDQVYVTIHATAPPLTNVQVDMSYMNSSGQQILGSGTDFPQGAYQSYSFLLTTTPPGGGSSVNPQIIGVFPTSYNNQDYIFHA